MKGIKKNLNRLLTVDFLFRRTKYKNSVLLIRDDGIGDFLLFSGFLPLYKEFFLQKGLDLFLLVRKEVFPLANLYLQEDRIITLDKKLYYYSLSYRRNFLRKLLELSPACIVSSIHRSSEGDDIISLIGRGRITIGYEGEISIKRKNKRFLFDVFVESFDRKRVPVASKYNHVVYHERHFYSQLSNKKISLVECKPFIPLPKEENKIANHSYFSCIVGAGSFKRVYPTDKLAKVITFILKKTNFKCLLLGGEKDLQIASLLVNFLPPSLRDRIINLVGKTSLIESLLLIRDGILTIGNETGLVHASWIMEIPTIMIYGGGHFGRFLPLNRYGNVVYKRLDCYCCNWRCSYKETPVRCIASIKEEDIYQLVDKILKWSIRC
ncbi:MAG: glycosyltransferase family 9 protein [Desulfurobacteriaceae bacterium]